MNKATLSTPDLPTLRGSKPGIRNGLRNEEYPTAETLINGNVKTLSS